jgi:HK97 family phage portal protein
MANPFTNFINSRFVDPAVERRLASEPVEKNTQAFAVGVLQQPTLSLRDALGQYPDADYDLLYNVYQRHADVSACVALWAGGVTGNGWHIGLLDTEAEPTDKQRTAIADLERWLKNPNPTKRFSRIMYELVAHLGVTGDAYLNKVTDSKGRIVELWGVHPATVRIVADEHGLIKGYIQRYRGKNVATFQPGEISRYQLPSVVNDLYGHSPLESVMQEVNLDIQALRANKAIFDNGFKPSVIVRMKDGVKDTVERLAALITQRHTGAAHQHGIVAVSGVEEITPYAQTLKDMEFTALRELTTQKVSTAYRVPKFMLNLKGAHDLATSSVQERQFFNSTIKPLQDLVAEVFTEDIIHSFDPELAFYFNEPDFNDTDALRTDALKANEAGIIDDDEVREQYFFLPKKTPEQLAADDAKRQAAQAQFQAQTDTQPATTPTTDKPAADTTPKDQAGTEATQAPAKKSVSKRFTQPQIEALRAERETIHDQLEAAIHPSIVDYFGKQESRYLDKIATTFKSLPTRGKVQKAVIDDLIDPYFSDALPDDHSLAIILYTDLSPSLVAGVVAATAQIQAAGQAAGGTADGSTGPDLAISFTMGTTAQSKVVDDYLLKNALDHAKGINDTTKSQLKDTLREGIGQGEGIPQLRNRVKDVFSEASTNRANTIARTETAQAFEAANQQAMKESGVVEKKGWLSANDSRVRPAHRLLEGMVVKLDQKFPSINGPIDPGEEFSCRCTSIAVIE